jgi:hypothetical protein
MDAIYFRARGDASRRASTRLHSYWPPGLESLGLKMQSFKSLFLAYVFGSCLILETKGFIPLERNMTSRKEGALKVHQKALVVLCLRESLFTLFQRRTREKGARSAR